MKRLTRSALLLLLLPALAACTGPKPQVVGYALQPPVAADGDYRELVTVRNGSGGEGEVQVTVRLIVAATGETAAIVTQPLTMNPHETARIAIPLHPALPGPYREEVQAEYPT